MEQVTELLMQIQGRLDGMDVKLGQIVKEITAVKIENEQLRLKVEKQDERIEFLERELRKKNLIITGVVDEEGEKEHETLEKILVVMNNIGVEIDKEKDLEDLLRLGKYKATGMRPILIKMRKYSKKTEILKQAKNLKGTTIGINEDYPKEVQEERKKLIPIMKESRAKGQKAFIKYNKLIIDNEIYKTAKIDLENQQQKQREKYRGSSSSVKRPISERSPNSDRIETELKKVTRIWKGKN